MAIDLGVILERFERPDETRTLRGRGRVRAMRGRRGADAPCPAGGAAGDDASRDGPDAETIDATTIVGRAAPAWDVDT